MSIDASAEALKKLLVLADANLLHLSLDEVEELCHGRDLLVDERLWPGALKRLYLEPDPLLKRALHLIVETHYGGLMRHASGADFWRLSALAYTRVVPLRLGYEESMGHQQSDAVFVARAIETAFPTRARSGLRVLDVGCGTGELLSYLASIGFDSAEGIDVSRAAVAQARVRLNGTMAGVKCMSLRRVLEDVPSQRFDAVAICDVLEHLPPVDVPGILRGLKRLLSSQGLLVVVTPSAISGPHDLDFLPRDSPRTGLHLHEYRLTELRAALLSSGFEALQTSFVAPSVRRLGTPSAWAFSAKVGLEPIIARAPFPLAAWLTERLYFRGIAARAK